MERFAVGINGSFVAGAAQSADSVNRDRRWRDASSREASCDRAAFPQTRRWYDRGG